MTVALGLCARGAFQAGADLAVASCEGFDIISFCGDTGASEQRLARMVALQAELGAFLPLSPANALTPDCVAAYLGPLAQQICAALHDTAGQCEFVIAIETQAEEPRQLSAASGRDWLRARGEAVGARAQRVERLRDWCANWLGGAVLDWRLLAIESGAQLVLRVQKTQSAALQTYLATCLHDDQGATRRPEFVLALHVTGPWPLLHYAREVLHE